MNAYHRSLRRGTIAPMLALSSVALFSFVALAIDLGMLTVARTECQNAADAAALTGTRVLSNKPSVTDNDRTAAEAEALARATSNYVMNQLVTASDVALVKSGLYRYDTTQQRFYTDFTSAKAAEESWTTMKVTVRGNQPAYFSKLFGLSTLNMSATAVAVHRPRDIAFVLDFSGSMRFGTTGNWATSSSATEGGWLNADPSYPKFGHYQRYTSYSTNPNNLGTATSPSSRPNPLYATQGYVMSSGELLAPANFTVTTQGGPPCVEDFYFDTGNLSTPTTAATPVNPSNLSNAFVRGTMPTPSNFEDQSGTYDGDYWPRKNGQTYPASTSWDPVVATGTARNLAEMLGWLGTLYPNGYTTTTTPTVNPPARTAMTPSTPAYVTTWTNFRDATWETYGYDMDVADYRARRPVNHDPRTTLPSNTTGGIAGQVKVTAGKFKGYSMGPAYWGKTFFMWPPDPRTTWDWRQKFFFNRSGAPMNKEVDNDTATTGSQNISQEILTNAAGKTVTAPTGNYTINYPAILTWIKSGTQTLPPNLRAGKVVYYTSIPNDVNTGTGSAEQILDKVFWKNYIDYVIGSNFTAYDNLAGHENRGWPEGTTPAIGATAAYTFTTPSTTDPLPYMNYLDNPSRPRMHFWFGPATMMSFLADSKANWWSGTIHEAQCWQLKVAINSVLSDIRNNHPNDYAGLCFFSHNSAYFKTIRSPMSQDWTTAKNALFYPFNLVPTASPTSTAEVRPYDTNFNSVGSSVNSNIPNANGGTDPNSGFAMAYNLLSSSPSVNSDPYKRGRRGAAKVVIFETDGVPNSYQNWLLNSYGYDSYYTNTGNGASTGNGSTLATQPAYDIVTQIRKATASSNGSGVDSGFSTPNTPARVYAIGFGDLFGNPSASQNASAKDFLLNIQKLGGTSASTDTTFPADQLITGDYTTRISNMRAVLERIMQSGVQVTLVE